MIAIELQQFSFKNVIRKRVEFRFVGFMTVTKQSFNILTSHLLKLTNQKSNVGLAQGFNDFFFVQTYIPHLVR